MPQTRNVFAQAVTQTKFNVTNNSNGHLNNQYILVYVTPVAQAENWLYAAWQQLNPGDGSTRSFILDQKVSGQMLSTDGLYTTNQVAIPPSYVSSLTNSGGLEPVLGAIQLGSQVNPPTVTNTQSGIKNQTMDPGSAMYAQWLLNGNLTVQSLTPISAGGTLSAFELNTTLYWAVGTFQKGPSYSYNQVTASTAYALPPNTPEVNVSLTYNDATQQFEWSFNPPSDQ